MNKLILAASLIVILASCSSTKNNSSSKADKDGWQTLFDGKTTNGWHVFGQKDAGTFWKVQNGILFPDRDNAKEYRGTEIGDLVTDEEFTNFHLKMEWRISEKGNSGILFYVKESPEYRQSYITGPEMQVLDNGTPTRLGHSDAKIYTHRAGDLYDLLASEDASKPQGEWNEVEIRSFQGKLDFYMNGKHTLSTTLWNPYWNEMVAISKFKDMPGFGKYKTGKIALQFHNDAVWFRNIRIKKL